ncbi:lantibiotic ABC transporter permease [Anaerococcus octavius]|uniref:Lantibiotic ABC transporter permease n=2 Tax=Anaerococcus octavius TaxID=54007 RepID=A0A2I1MB87_9FIRM|nr:lantibiotic ABC transporter permease [Anaerococcus octavius]
MKGKIIRAAITWKIYLWILSRKKVFNMVNILKAEILKEKRSANAKILLLTPIIFIVFNLLMNMLMTPNSDGHSYLLATAFNWFPLLILPIVISLLVTNILAKEKQSQLNLQKSMGLDRKKIKLIKSFLVLIEVFVIVMVSILIIYLIANFILKENTSFVMLLKAGVVLFIGSLPLVGFSFFIMSLTKKNFIVLILNFILSIISPIPAVEDLWKFYPWSYSLRMLAPIVGVHPNGTFLDINSPLWDKSVITLGIILSLGVYILFMALSINRKDKENA